MPVDVQTGLFDLFHHGEKIDQSLFGHIEPRLDTERLMHAVRRVENEHDVLWCSTGGDCATEQSESDSRQPCGFDSHPFVPPYR